MKKLYNPALFKTRAFIDGEWVTTAETFEVENPSTGEVITTVSDCGVKETESAIKSAADAFPGWKNKTAGERSAILRRWYELMIENKEDLARILTTEQGKPLPEAMGEIDYGAGFIEWFAEEAKRTYGDTIPGHQAGKRILTIKQPVGVVAMITPWNFPNAMITRKAGPALAAGCTVVIKPAEATPLSALAIAHLALEAGIPKGVLNIVPTNSPREVGEVLTTHPVIKKFSFTGSTEVGKQLIKQCASTVKNVSMELGGNAPFIVFDDANLEAAVEGAIASKYRNAGQTCVCANRIYVQEGIYDQFVEALKKANDELQVGDGFEEGVVIGPLINDEAVDFVIDLIEDAKSQGAQIHQAATNYEGKRYFPPTVISGASPSMKLHSNEIFGPVSPVYKFQTEEELIEMANDTPYGLASYFYGTDHARLWRVAEALEYGIVGINTGLISTPVAPFGGVKESGFGKEGSKYGMDEYLELKYICWDIGE